MRTLEIHKKSSDINDLEQEPGHKYGDFLRYQKSPEMTFDTTRRYTPRFQEVTFSRNLNMLTELWRIFTICNVIQNLGWTQLESTSNIIVIRIENVHLDGI